MSRNPLVLLAALGISWLLYSCQPTGNSQSATAEGGNGDRPPNIIYILADDLGYGDLSCYGQKKFDTPHIDRLAQEGLRFTQHYSGSTVCAPSRSALLTGQHTGHTFIRGNHEIQPEGQYPLPADTLTLAEILQSAGYTTGAFGKWGLGYPGSEGDPIKQGFDVFYGYNCQRMGHHYYPRHLWSNRDSVPIPANAGKNKGAYAPDLIHEQAIQFIKNNKDQAFFLYLPSIIPHAELIAPDSIQSKYVGQFEPDEAYEGYDEGPNYRLGPYESQAHPHAAFVAMVEILDRQVGEIVSLIDELGLGENTLIIFTSDNGPHQEGGADPTYFDSNGPLKGFKRDLYEGGIRVPMIARWKQTIAPGQVTDHVSAFWDVLPTVAEASNLTLEAYTDGISFLPTLLGNPDQQRQHDFLYWEFHEKGGRIAVRQGNWKAVKYNVLKQPNAPLELYNLSNDIGETNNLANSNPEMVAKMEEIMDQARTPSDVFRFGQKGYLSTDE